MQSTVSECNSLSDITKGGQRKGTTLNHGVREGLSGEVKFKLRPKCEGLTSTNILGQGRLYCAHRNERRPV